MKTIVFLGSNKSGSSYEAIRAADNMGYYTVLLTDRPSFIDKRIDFPHAHSVRQCDLSSLNEIKSALKRLDIALFDIRAIVSFIDPYCHTAAILSREYNLKYFSETAISAMLDKIKSRELLADTPYAPFFYVTESPIIGIKTIREMPLVLKLPVSTGSKDVYPVSTASEYKKIFNKLRERSSTPVLVEKFIDGTQYLVETLTVNGRTVIVAVIEQEVTFTGRFIITGYRMSTADIDPSLKAAVENIIKLHGMQNGPCHLELRYFNGKWILIEANPRISGGAMNAFIETAYGIDLAGETLKFALGQEPNLDCKYKKETYLRYIIVQKGGILEKVTGKNAALNSAGVRHVYVKPKKGTELHPPSSMGYRYAYVIATGSSSEESVQNAKNAASKIKFHLHAFDERHEKTAPIRLRQRVPHNNSDEFSDNVVFVY
jgi:biotin carboxylase